MHGEEVRTFMYIICFNDGLNVFEQSWVRQDVREE